MGLDFLEKHLSSNPVHDGAEQHRALLTETPEPGLTKTHQQEQDEDGKLGSQRAAERDVDAEYMPC